MNKTFCSKLKDHELRKDRIRLAYFCLPLYKVVSYHLNFGINQISSLPSAELILPTIHDSPHSYTFSLFHGDNSN